MRRAAIRAVAVCVGLGVLSLLDEATAAISLRHPRYHASGAGNVTTTGSMTAGGRALTVGDIATWSAGQGIRVRRAGEPVRVHNADAGWNLPPGAPPGATVSHDDVDKVEGAASVRCRLAGVPAVLPVDLCEVDLGAPTSLGDELRVQVKSSVATAAGALRIRILRLDDPVNPHDCAAPIVNGRCATFELDLPAVNAGAWQEVFVELKRTAGNGLVDHFSGGHRIVSLQCTQGCEGIDVRLDDLWFVKDLVGVVDSIDRRAGTFQLDRAAGWTVGGETVYHDDTVAVRTWLQEADRPGGAELVAPPGVYYVNGVDLFGVGGAEGSYSLPLYNDTHLQCANRATTIFKNTGRSLSGPGAMFRSAAPAPANITIENCGFDWNGWNLQDFATVLIIAPHTDPAAFASNIVIRRNAFFDSALPGIEGCDFGQDECRTRQRHHVLAVKVDGLRVEGNAMSGGGPSRPEQAGSAGTCASRATRSISSTTTASPSSTRAPA